MPASLPSNCRTGLSFVVQPTDERVVLIMESEASQMINALESIEFSCEIGNGTRTT